jgi:hypothetical protein
MHAIEHPSVNRLETIPDIGQGPAHDHTHGVLEIGLLHLIFNVHYVRTYIGHHVSLLINFLPLIENDTPKRLGISIIF